MTHRMGSMIAAACVAGMVSAISGTARMPRPLPKPALEMPVISSAGIAAA